MTLKLEQLLDTTIIGAEIFTAVVMKSSVLVGYSAV
jgi:hypothetical protein